MLFFSSPHLTSMAVNTASDHAKWSFSDNLVYLTKKEIFNLNLANKLDNKKYMASFTPGFSIFSNRGCQKRLHPVF